MPEAVLETIKRGRLEHSYFVANLRENLLNIHMLAVFHMEQEVEQAELQLTDHLHGGLIIPGGQHFIQ